MKYKLTIEPAIPVYHRHHLEDALKELGYGVWAGGTHTDGSACDIAFDWDGGGREEEIEGYPV